MLLKLVKDVQTRLQSFAELHSGQEGHGFELGKVQRHQAPHRQRLQINAHE